MTGKKYLVDANLPYFFSFWNTPDYIHQNDFGDNWSDSKIWDFAKENNLTIITKDSDFSNKILAKDPPPRVIHVRVGNMKMNDFFTTIAPLWKEVLILSQEYKLINIFKDRIEGIN